MTTTTPTTALSSNQQPEADPPRPATARPTVPQTAAAVPTVPQTAAAVPTAPIRPATVAGWPRRVAAATTEAQSSQRVRQWLEARFWLPDRTTPRPTTGYIAGLSLWSALLGLLGCVVGLRAFVAVATDAASGWYLPVVTLAGLVSLVLAVAAYAAVPHPRRPWRLLAAATAGCGLAAVIAFAGG